jgi:hypothetical protein
MKAFLIILVLLSLLLVTINVDIENGKEPEIETNNQNEENDNQQEEFDEDAAINEAIISLELDKKEILTREDFRIFIEYLMTKNEDVENLPENEKDLMKFVVEKAIASVPEEFNKEELKEIIKSEKLKKTLSDAVAEKLGMDPEDLLENTVESEHKAHFDKDL